MKEYGLIGYPLSHSFSENYFADKFKKEEINDCKYSLFPLPNITDLEALIKRVQPEGLTVTTPYKLSVMDYLDDLDESAKAVGAVNTIFFGDKRIGFNTDVEGFRLSIEPLLGNEKPKALILGSGGAALAVAFALEQLQISSKVVSRSPEDDQLGYEGLTADIITEHKLIVNATPLGMYPNINSLPDIPYEGIKPEHLLYDLCYNPAETAFLKKANGARIKNGLEMLHIQAERAWDIWNR